jgi:hypothetical protein
MSYNVANCGSTSALYALRLGGSGGSGVYENLNIYGNTFANCPYGIAQLSNPASSPNNVFQNNVISTNQYYDIIVTDQATTNYTFAYNLLYTPYSTAIRWWNGTAVTNYTLAQFNTAYGCPGQWHCNSIQANPNVVDPPNFALATRRSAKGQISAQRIRWVSIRLLPVLFRLRAQRKTQIGTSAPLCMLLLPTLHHPQHFPLPSIK